MVRILRGPASRPIDEDKKGELADSESGDEEGDWSGEASDSSGDDFESHSDSSSDGDAAPNAALMGMLMGMIGPHALLQAMAAVASAGPHAEVEEDEEASAEARREAEEAREGMAVVRAKFRAAHLRQRAPDVPPRPTGRRAPFPAEPRVLERVLWHMRARMLDVCRAATLSRAWAEAAASEALWEGACLERWPALRAMTDAGAVRSYRALARGLAAPRAGLRPAVLKVLQCTREARAFRVHCGGSHRAEFHDPYHAFRPGWNRSYWFVLQLCGLPLLVKPGFDGTAEDAPAATARALAAPATLTFGLADAARRVRDGEVGPAEELFAPTERPCAFLPENAATVELPALSLHVIHSKGRGAELLTLPTQLRPHAPGGRGEAEHLLPFCAVRVQLRLAPEAAGSVERAYAALSPDAPRGRRAAPTAPVGLEALELSFHDACGDRLCVADMLSALAFLVGKKTRPAHLTYVTLGAGVFSDAGEREGPEVSSGSELQDLFEQSSGDER